MRKKKTSENIVQEQPTELKQETTVQTSFGNNINYKGTINVTVKKGKQVISKKTYHNHGTNFLFEFLCNCLTNDIPDTRKAPVAIRLYNNTDASQDPTNIAINENSAPLTDYIYYARREITQKNNAYQAHLEFTISCNYVNNPNNTSSSFASINQVGLYSTENADSSGSDTTKYNYSAVFNFSDSTTYDWDPITVHANSGDYQIFIDWVLSFNG